MQHEDHADAREFVHQYSRLVLSAARRILPDPDDSHDVFQETFLRYYETVESGESILFPKAWLCQTAINAAFRRLRQRRREAPLPDVPSADTTPVAEALDRARLMDRIRECAAELPERQRTVFALRNFENMKFAEIAAVVGCTEEAARASEYKALRKIRAELADFLGD